MNRTLLYATTLILGLAACSPTVPAPQPSSIPIKIGTLTPLSGPQSQQGIALKEGAELALLEAQPRFISLGFTLSLVALDDEATPAVGTAAAAKLIGDSELLAVMGTLNSGVAFPVSILLAEAKLAMVSPTNTANILSERGLTNYNRISARDNSQGTTAAAFISGVLKPQKVYLLNDGTAYGLSLTTAVSSGLSSSGVVVVGNETIETSNFASLIERIQANGANLVYFAGIYDQVGPFAKQLRQAGFTQPLVGADGLDNAEFKTLAGQGAKNTYFTSSIPDVEVWPASAGMRSSFKTRFGKDALSFAVLGYDAMNVVLSGLESAIAGGKTAPTRAAVQDAIRKVNWAGLTGPIRFDTKGDRVDAQFYIAQIDDALNTSWRKP